MKIHEVLIGVLYLYYCIFDAFVRDACIKSIYEITNYGYYIVTKYAASHYISLIAGESTSQLKRTQRHGFSDYCIPTEIKLT